MDLAGRRVPFTELIRLLGPPTSRRVWVMFGAQQPLPERRSASMLWHCTIADAEDGPVACYATNSLPYQSVVFSVEEFPAGTWVVVPCRLHADVFSDFPAVDPAP
jgi:hypothetical protein